MVFIFFIIAFGCSVLVCAHVCVCVCVCECVCASEGGLVSHVDRCIYWYTQFAL